MPFDRAKLKISKIGSVLQVQDSIAVHRGSPDQNFNVDSSRPPEKGSPGIWELPGGHPFSTHDCGPQGPGIRRATLRFSAAHINTWHTTFDKKRPVKVWMVFDNAPPEPLYIDLECTVAHPLQHAKAALESVGSAAFAAGAFLLHLMSAPFKQLFGK